MKNAQKMSHKALKEMGKALGGYYFDGNIYAHENRVHYLATVGTKWGADRAEEAKKHSGEAAALIDEVSSLGAEFCRFEQLAYSCGYYGNSGQLHRLEYCNDNGETLRVLFLYV